MAWKLEVVNAEKARGLKPLDSETRTKAQFIPWTPAHTDQALGCWHTYPSMYDFEARNESSLVRLSAFVKSGSDMSM